MALRRARNRVWGGLERSSSAPCPSLNPPPPPPQSKSSDRAAAPAAAAPVRAARSRAARRGGKRPHKGALPKGRGVPRRRGGGGGRERAGGGGKNKKDLSSRIAARARPRPPSPDRVAMRQQPLRALLPRSRKKSPRARALNCSPRPSSRKGWPPLFWGVVSLLRLGERLFLSSAEETFQELRVDLFSAFD